MSEGNNLQKNHWEFTYKQWGVDEKHQKNIQE